MYAVYPNQKYLIFNIRIAVPAHLSEAHIADAVNETLRPCIGDPEDNNAYWIADYEFGAQLNEADEVTASDDPEEGELFY